MKLLVLSESCDLPLYNKEESVARRTWAYSLPEGVKLIFCKSAGPSGFETYDSEQSVLRVPCPDDLSGTYAKTIRSLAWSIRHLNFDFVLKTNVSTYIDIRAVKQFVDGLSVNDLHFYGTRTIQTSESGGCPHFCGLFMLFSKTMVKNVLASSYEDVLGPDDSLIGRALLSNAIAYGFDYYGAMRELPMAYTFGKTPEPAPVACYRMIDWETREFDADSEMELHKKVMAKPVPKLVAKTPEYVNAFVDKFEKSFSSAVETASKTFKKLTPKKENPFAHSKQPKIAVCCIGKCENQYVRGYVEHYKKIGIDKIFIYDNNDSNGEHFEDVIGDYINAGFVKINDVRGRKQIQMPVYEDCYNENKYFYDWFFFIDCGDEYFCTGDGTDAKSFLSNPCFSDYDVIHVNLMTYGDGGQLYSDGRPLLERITEPVMPLDFKRQYDFPENDHVSSIVRGGLPVVQWRSTPHTPSNPLKCCDAAGRPVDSTSPFVHPFDFSKAHFKHFQTKTITEYAEKIRRGYPDQSYASALTHLNFNEFFKLNEKTPEKVALAEKLSRELANQTRSQKTYAEYFNF